MVYFAASVVTYLEVCLTCFRLKMFTSQVIRPTKQLFFFKRRMIMEERMKCNEQHTKKDFFIKQKAVFKVLIFFVFFVHEVYFLKQLLGYICELNLLQLFFKKMLQHHFDYDFYSAILFCQLTQQFQFVNKHYFRLVACNPFFSTSWNCISIFFRHRLSDNKH